MPAQRIDKHTECPYFGAFAPSLQEAPSIVIPVIVYIMALLEHLYQLNPTGNENKRSKMTLLNQGHLVLLQPIPLLPAKHPFNDDFKRFGGPMIING